MFLGCFRSDENRPGDGWFDSDLSFITLEDKTWKRLQHPHKRSMGNAQCCQPICARYVVTKHAHDDRAIARVELRQPARRLKM